MKEKKFSLLMSKYLIILLTIVFITSCEIENNNPKQTYSFDDYSFNDNVECYDTIGNRFDSLSYMYSQRDFIYSDEIKLPYEKIDIMEDSTVILYYMEDDKEYKKNVRVTQKNDTLYFYFDDLSDNYFLFKGLIDDNQLKIPGYGYIYHTYLSNGVLSFSEELKTIRLGIPDLEYLLKKFPSTSLNNSNIDIRNLYIQRFELIYEMNIR
jgi:hypothetical protein